MTDFFVVVERTTLDNHDPMPPFVVGPYTEQVAIEEAESESGVIQALVTVDAKKEAYIVDDCYVTDAPPTGERIIPPEEDA